eukprot:9538856-Alexandrium_andersonii.AAC.1
MRLWDVEVPKEPVTILLPSVLSRLTRPVFGIDRTSGGDGPRGPRRRQQRTRGTIGRVPLALYIPPRCTDAA